MAIRRVTAEKLHEAADKIPLTPPPEGTEFHLVMEEAVRFVGESTFSFEDGSPISMSFDQALGYGIILGYLVARKELDEQTQSEGQNEKADPSGETKAARTQRAHGQN